MADQNLGSEQEITLRDYVNVIIKRKKLILAVFFIFAIAAIAISFTTPKTREVSMIIEIGSLDGANSLNPVFLDSPVNIMAKIEMGVFDKNVIDALKLDQEDAGFRVKVSRIKDSVFLELRIREPEDKKELGIRILNQYFNEISGYYKKVVDARTRYIDKKISFFSDMIRDKGDLIKLDEAQGEIGSFGIEIEKLKSAKDSIHNFTLVIPPKISSGTLGPNSVQNVLAGGIAGLIFGVFMAFFVEYWQGLKRL